MKTDSGDFLAIALAIAAACALAFASCSSGHRWGRADGREELCSKFGGKMVDDRCIAKDSLREVKP